MFSRLQALSLSQWALLAANLLPVLGVLVWDWSVYHILLLYWFENIIIGGLNLVKMLSCTNSGIAQKLFLSIFFTFHFGMFTLAHGTLIFHLFGDNNDVDLFDMVFNGDFIFLQQTITQEQLALPILALCFSHGFSLVNNYWLKGEYRRLTVQQLMVMPYSRVMVLHVTGLVGGILAQWLGSPVWALLVLIVLKLIVDLRSHTKEHELQLD